MDQAASYIALSVPVFFLLIGLELLLGKIQKTQHYRFNDALTNISCGIGQQVLGVFLKTVLLVGYVYLYEHHRLLEIPSDQWWVWLALFLGVDFCYYWFHRYAHEISLMWGGHIVHHQSEEYNLSVALRQGAFQTSFSWIFYLPLAFIGFDPLTFVVVSQLVTLYQFWIHTRAIKKLPFMVEYIFNTPSHHRVHHGINPKYIDKNHAGTLIIWDRMFGTFQVEEEEVVYGITKPLQSWNPVWANLEYFRDVFRLATQVKNPWDFCKVFFMPPGWRPDYLGGQMEIPEVSVKSFKKFDTLATKWVNFYVLFQYLVVLSGASLFLFKSVEMEMIYGENALLLSLVIAGLIIAGIASLGAVLGRSKGAVFGESGRLLLMVGTVPVLFGPLGRPEMVWAVCIVFGGISLAWLMAIRKDVKGNGHGSHPVG